MVETVVKNMVLLAQASIPGIDKKFCSGAGHPFPVLALNSHENVSPKSLQAAKPSKGGGCSPHHPDSTSVILKLQDSWNCSSE